MKLMAMFAVFVSFFSAQLAQAASFDDVSAFVDVNVVPMSSGTVLPNQTVIVKNGRITSIGRALAIPKGVHIIEGHGAFLSPGLADMHSHSDSREDLEIYLVNGVTSILNMGDASAGFIDHLKPAVNNAEIPGPHVYAAFMIDGSSRYNNLFVTTPYEARAIVHIAKTDGYDFIMVYNDLSADCFQAIINEGKLLHMPVVGHGVTAVGIRRQLDMGQVMVAHAEEFLYTVFFDAAHIPYTGAPDTAKIPAVIDFVLRDKAFVTADLDTYTMIANQWGKPDGTQEFLRNPEARYLGPKQRITWARSGYQTRKGSIDLRVAFLTRFIKAMNDAGVPLIAGTDAPNVPGLLPGFSLHDDLDLLKRAGLSPYQVLATATRTPGEFIHRSLPDAERFGMVVPGYRADLVLTAANPLDELSTLRTPLGVMANGRWHGAAELHELLDGVATEYDKALLHH